MPKPADDAPLADRLGYFLSEYIDDNAPLNERYYIGGARAAIERFGLVEASADVGAASAAGMFLGVAAEAGPTSADLPSDESTSQATAINTRGVTL